MTAGSRCGWTAQGAGPLAPVCALAVGGGSWAEGLVSKPALPTLAPIFGALIPFLERLPSRRPLLPCWQAGASARGSVPPLTKGQQARLEVMLARQTVNAGAGRGRVCVCVHVCVSV